MKTPSDHRRTDPPTPVLPPAAALRAFRKACAALLLLPGCLAGCHGRAERAGAAVTQAVAPEVPSLSEVAETLRSRVTPIVLRGEGDSAVLVSPRLQGRILTAQVGSVASSGFVSEEAIRQGEVNDQFNNFGGMDRFWIGPEAGPYGLYFEPGAEFTRDVWRVPRHLNQGAFEVIRQQADRLTMTREMEVTNTLGVAFKVHVEREVGLIPPAALAQELGVQLPQGVHYVGCFSDNTLTNAGTAPWDPEKGLVGIWILGQFNASNDAVVIAPFKEAEGPIFNDEYFGKVSEETPERLKVLESAVLFRGDACRVGKFGLAQQRTTGVAGSFDFGTNLLTVVKFDVPREPARYGNSLWIREQADPYGGDPFQSYNNGVLDEPGVRAPDAFYELESTSPVKPLAPGEALRHRHATFLFQGPYAELKELARSVLGTDLDEVRRRMLE